VPASIPPRETNTLRRRALFALLALGVAAAAAAPPPEPARELLAPRFFPVWQARNVAFPFVLHDRAAGLYRMYYAGSGAAQFNDSAWDQWMTGLVTSRDGRTWTMPDDYEPVLRPWRFATGEVTESARRDRFDAMAAFGVCVLRDGGRYLMWYTGWNGDDVLGPDGIARPTHGRIGLATSGDGVRWTKVAGDAGAGAVLGLGPAGSADEQAAGQPFVLRDGTAYRMWYEAFDGRTWRIATARSADGRAWTREGVALEPGGPEARDALGARNPVVLKRGGRWELWYQGRGAAAPSSHVLRAVSDDGRRWTKLPGELQLDPPLAGDEAVHVDSALVLPGGAVRIFLARQKTLRRKAAWGTVESPSFHISAARVNP
jgi:hypothetical protein